MLAGLLGEAQSRTLDPTDGADWTLLMSTVNASSTQRIIEQFNMLVGGNARITSATIFRDGTNLNLRFSITN